MAGDNWRDGMFAIHNISLVCKAFHEHSSSVLFKDVSLSQGNGHYHSLVLACKQIENLFSLINTNPGLAKGCKSLKFSLPCTAPELGRAETNPDWLLANRLLTSLPQVQMIEIHGGFGYRPSWLEISQLLRSMSHLKSLKFGFVKLATRAFPPTEQRDLYLPDVWRCVQDLDLRSLELDGIRSEHNISLWNMSKELVRTSPIINISLEDFGETPKALRTLLRGPKALEHFAFHISNANRASKLWSLETLRTLLYDHCHSLKSIGISALSKEKSISPFNTSSNFHGFPKLEKLTISPRDMDANVTPEIAHGFASNLRHFIWDFTLLEREPWHAFGKDQRDWLLKFAKLAIERGATLRKIDIVFTPSDEIGMGDVIRAQMQDFWPWDLMDEVRDAVCPHIELVYNDHVSKEHCEMLIDSYREYVAGYGNF
ncbi:uncharacterized protein LY89DRAFT_750160 [Mollisia scopiformis]|uniref:Uncharacterized protein n=1 Tax=Mollisia scopiformis TaxID=149040 RepID=A0A194X886_MOLSC|nr:uncharacterized protein LY89DRAFT_750160 [Mollisia scopiformis]KUJ16007.1 hypothetical protein LY89DRAFT_750160 [Mollisia scopiformis]